MKAINPNLLQLGDTILDGQYTIEKHLGNGGQGQVYLAKHQYLGKRVVKRLHQHVVEQQAGFDRFSREVKVTNELYQRYGEQVIFIFDYIFDQVRKEFFVVMEYANCGSLEDKLSVEAPLPIIEAIELSIALCQAIAPIHEHPYVHGDLKPGNILLHNRINSHKSNQDKPILKLSDFGSAFQPPQTDTIPLSSSLSAARTIPYVSPELLEACNLEAKMMRPVAVDQRADIYAIGVILYEMLIGRPPFWEGMGESDPPEVRQAQKSKIEARIKQEIPLDPKSLRSDIPSSLSELVMKALAKRPTDRFNSVVEMQSRLVEIYHEKKLYDEEQLASLRNQIQQKLEDRAWSEADKLIKEALQFVPDDQVLKAWQEEVNEQLLTSRMLEQARRANSRRDWPKVIRLCRGVIDRGGKDAEVSAMLKYAEAQVRIDGLRRRVNRLHQQGNKKGELEVLKRILEETPSDETLKAEIGALETVVTLEINYAQGKQAYGDQQWAVAIEALERVTELDARYRDAAILLVEAQKQFNSQRKAELEKIKKELTTQHHETLQKLVDEAELLINGKQWMQAWEIVTQVRREKDYQAVISKNDLLVRLFYVAGHRCSKAQHWYLAQLCFSKALGYRDAEQQFVQARNDNLLRRNYRIKTTLRSSITSQVDEAEDMRNGDRHVCLKYLRASYIIGRDVAINRHFRRHAQRCMKLHHKHIVETYAVEMRTVTEDPSAEAAVMVMEYIEGKNLSEFLGANKQLSERQVIHFIRQLCLALQYAHERKMLHADVNPKNIIIRPDGVLKLFDFDLTQFGTVGYRAPEQRAGISRILDERTDVFAVGKVLYALLTGISPADDHEFDANDQGLQKITPDLRAVICKAIAPNPQDRYQSTQEVIEALQRAEATLPRWPENRQRVKHAWQQTLIAAKTWQGILSVIGTLLAIIIIPLLIQAASADPDTPLGKMWTTLEIYLLGGNTPATIPSPRLIGEIEFRLNGNRVEDTTQPYPLALSEDRRVEIEVLVQDVERNPINDKVLCKWIFDPAPSGQTNSDQEGCRTSYQVPEDWDDQLVKVEIQGKDTTEVAGTSKSFINIIWQSD